MSEADGLVEAAQRQLEEHKRWLAGQLYMTSLGVVPDAKKMALITQAGEIKLRVVRVSGNLASVVYEYPDELYAFLSSAEAPSHLRATLAGGHVVDPDQPTFKVTREVGP